MESVLRILRKVPMSDSRTLETSTSGVSSSIPESQKSQALSLREALDIHGYLFSRKVLCDKCGWRLACVENAFQLRCQDCKSPTAHYETVTHSNFERRISDCLRRW